MCPTRGTHSEKFAFYDNQLIYVPRVGHILKSLPFQFESLSKIKSTCFEYFKNEHITGKIFSVYLIH